MMGEHKFKDDKTIEQILEEEAQAKALVAAEREAEELMVIYEGLYSVRF